VSSIIHLCDAMACDVINFPFVEALSTYFLLTLFSLGRMMILILKLSVEGL